MAFELTAFSLFPMDILLTGASGFLGKELRKELAKDHRVLTLGRSVGSDVRCDLAREIPVLPPLDVVVHAAGKAHSYPRTEEEKAEFFRTNRDGTQNLLNALDSSCLRGLVLVSTVAVYGLESGEGILENTPLRGKTPYALSRIQAERLVLDWCEASHVPCIVLRLPLVVGHEAPGNLGKLTKAIRQGGYVRLAKGSAYKSAVLAEDVAILIRKWVGTGMSVSGIYNLTDGHNPSFYDLEEAVRNYYEKPPLISIPAWLGIGLGRLGDILPFFPINSSTIRKITETFTFSDAKARKELGWFSRSVLRLYERS